MSAIRVASDIAFGASTGVLASEWEHVSAVAAPVSANIGQGLEAMRNSMIDLLLISVLKVCELKSRGEKAEALTPDVDFDMHFVTTFSKHFLWQVYRQSSH
jgi:hypothetical protein